MVEISRESNFWEQFTSKKSFWSLAICLLRRVKFPVMEYSQTFLETLHLKRKRVQHWLIQDISKSNGKGLYIKSHQNAPKKCPFLLKLTNRAGCKMATLCNSNRHIWNVLSLSDRKYALLWKHTFCLVFFPTPTSYINWDQPPGWEARRTLGAILKYYMIFTVFLLTHIPSGVERLGERV